MQIEQFIESIFPSQDPKAIIAAQAAASAPATESEKKDAAMAAESKKDTSKSIPFRYPYRFTNGPSSVPPRSSIRDALLYLMSYGESAIDDYGLLLFLC